MLAVERQLFLKNMLMADGHKQDDSSTKQNLSLHHTEAELIIVKKKIEEDEKRKEFEQERKRKEAEVLKKASEMKRKRDKEDVQLQKELQLKRLRQEEARKKLAEEKRAREEEERKKEEEEIRRLEKLEAYRRMVADRQDIKSRESSMKREVFNKCKEEYFHKTGRSSSMSNSIVPSPVIFEQSQESRQTRMKF